MRFSGTRLLRLATALESRVDRLLKCLTGAAPAPPTGATLALSNRATLALPAGAALALSTGVALTMSAGAASAQNAYLYSPVHYTSTEGEYFCYQFGAWRELRYQMVDGENRGVAATLKTVAVRLDHRSHTPSTTASARSWASVTLDLADGDSANTTSNFSTNMLSAPTRVFSGTVRWPDVTGTPPTRPATFGGLTGAYEVPFQNTWAYSGTRDILTDWNFSGGTLGNNASWVNPRGYWLDSYGDPDEPETGLYRRVPAKRLHNDSPGVTTRCNDSYFGAINAGSYATVSARVYGPSATNARWRDQLVMTSGSAFTAPGAPVIHAWAFATSDVGYDLLTGCNRLHLVSLTLYFTLPVPPAAGNPTASVTTPEIVTPWVDGLSTLRVVVQAGWADSQSGALRLTQAHEVILPGAPPPHAPFRAAVYQPKGGPVYGPDATYFANPALRYQR